jgi:phosphatidylserine decarboxylase
MLVALLILWDRSITLAVVGAGGTLWCLSVGFIFYFFRDPTPTASGVADVIVAPAHGTVDLVDETSLDFMGGPCKRISIFLSVLDVHVQYAPVAGKVVLSHHQQGRFLSALRADSSDCNENHLTGIEFSEGAEGRLAVRQIAGCIARRIRTWKGEGDIVRQGGRMGLIHFGSRCDLYLPRSFQILIKPGGRVVGGQTIVGKPMVFSEGSSGGRLEGKTGSRL